MLSTTEGTMLVLWIALLIAFIVAEAVTVQLTTVWFALGSLAALIANLCSAPVWLQWVIFAAVSLVALAVTRPFVKKLTVKRIQPTNADRFIGQQGVVEETIDNTEGKGLVRVKGAVWTARSTDGAVIEKGSSVTVDRIDGVKLMVSKH